MVAKVNYFTRVRIDKKGYPFTDWFTDWVKKGPKVKKALFNSFIIIYIIITLRDCW